MLTAELAQSWRRGASVRPLYLPPDETDYLEDAARLIKIFSEHEGEPRRALDETLAEYVGTGTNYKILRGLIKLLLDRCRFETVSAKDPAEIRRALFLKARDFHPITLDASRRSEVVTQVARELLCEPERLLEGLYADLPENQRLTAFNHLNGAELLNLYNLAQAQALLYHCVEMHLTVETQNPESYRELFGAIKAYRLIHTIQGNPQTGYEVRLDGPVSLFHRSQKYGVQMAVFLPALLLCKGWRMRAEIAQQNAPNQESAFFELHSNQKRLNSHYVSDPLAENSILENLTARWGRVETLWTLEASREVIDLGESAFIPDFVLSHPDGHRLYLEVLGFWTPQHLSKRLEEFEHAGFKDFILAAWDELRGSRDQLLRIPPHVITFKRNLDPVAVELAANDLITQEQ